jgi:glycosyltransferase involved in cell wall biosynthesis
MLPGAYTAATLFVHACEIETFGLSVLEAMSCGCPVIAVGGGAVPEVVGNAGVLIPVNDPDKYAADLCRLISDPSLRETLGKAALERAGKFSLHQMQHGYAEAIEQASGYVRAAPSGS